MKLLQILGVAAIAIGTSSTLAQALPSTIKPYPITNNGTPNIPPPPPNIVQNPGFETGDFTDYTLFDPNDPPQSTVASSNPHSGNEVALLGTISAFGFLSQNLPTVAGNTYSLSYYLSNDQSNDGSQEFITAVGGKNISDLTNVTPSPDGITYQQYNFTFKGSDNTNTTQLLFEYRNDPGFFRLDDIFVVPNSVPESSGSIGTLAFGVLGFGYLLKRRRESRNNLN